MASSSIKEVELSDTSELSTEEIIQLQDTLKAMRQSQQEARNKITLTKSPVTTIRTFCLVILRYLTSWWHFIKMHSTSMIVATMSLIAFVIIYNIPGSHQAYLDQFEEELFIACWWMLLGVLSSIGLGTGLHTFVLYLGPFIAKVTLAANECNSLNFETYGPNAFLCPESSTPEILSLWGILRKVQFAALLWGAGTAIGELPPYFVARAARLAGQQLEELQEVQQSEGEESFISRISADTKRLMFKALGKLGFFGIVLFASIPNPLFDLAGLTCGHFLVPFTTFFGATLLGKAVIKSHLQTIFVITMFSKTLLQYWIDLIERFVPFLKDSIDEFLEKQRAQFHRHAGQTALADKSILATMWDLVLISMLLYFLMSIVNSSVQGYLLERDEEEVANLERGKKNK